MKMPNTTFDHNSFGGSNDDSGLGIAAKLSSFAARSGAGRIGSSRPAGLCPCPVRRFVHDGK